jgi:hypothetical protein
MYKGWVDSVFFWLPLPIRDTGVYVRFCQLLLESLLALRIGAEGPSLEANLGMMQGRWPLGQNGVEISAKFSFW